MLICEQNHLSTNQYFNDNFLQLKENIFHSIERPSFTDSNKHLL